MRRIINPARSRAPTIAPMTMPAIAPPESPLLRCEAAAVAVEELEDVRDDVGDDVEELVVNVM
jgi:hypothetical protein